MKNPPKKDDTASLLIDPRTGSPLLDKQEILQQFHISNRTLQRWRTTRQLEYFKIGKKIYYSTKEILKMVRNSLVTRTKN